ncbi:immunoglobulin-like domain-containing protein [Amphibacillus sediminis]|uniref:immunoglobulin-like domain-containing protein n=1 Tax=Amphibacillus sediminis TaxID=360185 RepID=UPI000829AD3B|nr:immunoglobulin-like domain-containing protein [Amphibacillus sediminis]
MNRILSSIIIFCLLFSLYFPTVMKASTETISDLNPGDLVTYSDREWVYLQSMASQPQGLFMRTDSEISRHYYNSGSPVNVNTSFDLNDPLTVANWLNVTYLNQLSNTDWIQTSTWGGASAKIGLPSRDEAELNETIILNRLNPAHDYYTLTAASDYDINIINVRSRNIRNWLISAVDATVGFTPAVVAPAIYLHPDLYVYEGQVVSCIPPEIEMTPADADESWKQNVSAILQGGSCYNGAGNAEYRIQTPDGNWSAWANFTNVIEFDQEGRYVLQSRMSEEGSGVRNVHIWIDQTAPTIDLSAAPSTWTNQDVTITANVTDNGAIDTKKWAEGSQTEAWFLNDDNGTVFAGNTITVSENGTYSVFASDEAGNTAVATIEISHIDKDKPVMTLKGEPSISLERGSTFVDPGATANDAVDGDLSSSIMVAGVLDTEVPGKYTLTYSVSDRAGNKTILERDVRVVDILGVQLNTESKQWSVGDTHVLEANPIYEDGVIPDITTHSFSYTSSDETIATVDEAGKITFHADGNVQISASYGPVQETATFHVEEATISLNEDKVVLPGLTYRIVGLDVGDVWLRMPASLPSGTRLRIEEYAGPKQEGLRNVGPALSFHFSYGDGIGPDESDPFTLTFSYEESVDSDRVAIYYLQNGKWDYRGGTVNAEQQTITLDVPHFSTYGVFVETTAGVDFIDDDDSEQDMQEKVIDITEAGKQLPNTASSHFNLLTAGLLLLVSGGILLFYHYTARRRQQAK